MEMMFVADGHNQTKESVQAFVKPFLPDLAMLVPKSNLNNLNLHFQCILQVSNGISTGWYAVALQIEDFVSTSSSVAMSSVPFQFLVNVYSSSSSCDSEPILSSSLEDGSVVEVAVGSLWHETIVATSASQNQE